MAPRAYPPTIKGDEFVAGIDPAAESPETHPAYLYQTGLGKQEHVLFGKV